MTALMIIISRSTCGHGQEIGGRWLYIVLLMFLFRKNNVRSKTRYISAIITNN